ncbi:MAG: ABC transporter substrate-binding protein [Actinomycetia bacterium]|nr:ABC transporter substrate-binding protein [Actinomycetes bacterium]
MKEIENSFSRRQFMKYLGAASVGAGAVYMVGCSSDNTTTDTGSDTGGGAGLADTITYAQGADPRSLDPAFFDDGESAKVACNIYEGLYQYGAKDTAVSPCLALEMPEISADGLTYIIKLRQGVKFHDGTDFTADAVKASWERQLAPNLTSDMPYATFVFGEEATGTGLKAIEVVDPYTVKLTLRAPSTPFLKNMAMTLAAPIVSPAALAANSGNIGEDPCGTGPYKFVSWIKGSNVKLEAFDGYWDAANAAKTKNVIFQVIPDNTARVTALANGEVDMIDGVDVSGAQQIVDKGMTLFAEDGMTINYMGFNTNGGTCTDRDVRRALAQAINVEELVSTLYGDYATPANSVMPLWMASYDKDVKPVSYDPNAAKATLADKQVTKLSCITYSNPRPYNTKGGQNLAETIQGYLSQVGVDLQITPYDWTTYKDRIQKDSFDICFYGWTGDNGDPDNFMNLFADSNWSMNVTRWNNADYKALVKEGVTTPEGSAREAVYLKCEQMVADQTPLLCISHSKNLCGVNPKVHDFYYHPTGSVFLHGVTKDA